jgi:hypothetical protein
LEVDVKKAARFKETCQGRKDATLGEGRVVVATYPMGSFLRPAVIAKEVITLNALPSFIGTIADATRHRWKRLLSWQYRPLVGILNPVRPRIGL